MKKILLWTCSILVAIILTLYTAFLFVVPKIVDLTPYIDMVQKLAKEQVNLDVNITDLKIITAPDLSAGIQADNITVKLPDGSLLFGTDSIKGRLFIPSLFTLTAKISCLDIQSPKINLDIKDGKQFKVVQLVEDLFNAEESKFRQEQKVKIEDEEKNSWFNPEWIKIKVPNARIFDYQVKIDDPQSGHYLLLKGDELDVGYRTTAVGTKQNLKIKTLAKLYSDEQQNIAANIDINTFVPKGEKTSDNEDDPAEKLEIPFVNPVLMYRNYDFKTNISSKIKIRNKNGLIVSKGYFAADDISMRVKGLDLPSGFIGLKTKGTNVKLNTDFYVAQNSNIKFGGTLDYGKKPFAEIDLKTDKIFFDDLLTLTKGILDTVGVKHELAQYSAKGYFQANTAFKTNFKKLFSEGSIIARDGVLSNSTVGLIISKINANLIFDGNVFAIRDTYAAINDAKIKLAGMIDDKSDIALYIKSDALPLPQIYKAFAPKNLANSINISSGNLELDVNILGKIKEALVSANVVLSNFGLNDATNNFKITNEKLGLNLTSDFKKLLGEIRNENLRVNLPKTSSLIYNPLLILDIDGDNFTINRTEFKVNKASIIKLALELKNAISTQNLNLFVDGNFATPDLAQLIGETAEPFIEYKGKIPFKFSINGNKKRQEIIAQIFADVNNFISPIKIAELEGKQSIFQGKIIYKGNRLNIRKTGLFINPIPIEITNNLDANLQNEKEIAIVDGTIAGLGSNNPHINILTARLPKELNATLYGFKNSKLNLSGRLVAFGQLISPILRGHFEATNVSIPELFLTLEKGGIEFAGRDMNLFTDNLILNNNDFKIAGLVDLNKLPHLYIRHFDLISKRICLEDLLKVVDSAMTFVPSTTNSTPAKQNAPSDIPVTLKNGKFTVQSAQTGNIIATNTNGQFEFVNNIFNLSKLNTNAFDGSISGNASADVIKMAYKAAFEGSGIDVEKMFLQACNMKGALSGNLAFKTNVELNGVTFEEQVKSLKGDLTFLIQDGQFGPFGRLENLILAENIRESEFFKNTIGTVLTPLLTIDTTHFDTLDGLITFENGVVHLNPITSLGNVMSLHIAGDFDILNNTADMKVRGRLASMITNVLGPLAQLNPVNVVKATPGVNFLMLKAFALFCEEITQEEMDAVPAFEKGYDNDSATKFQVVLRGDVAKPLTLVKSFKWLAVASEMAMAQDFMANLPEPVLDENGNYVIPTAEEIALREKEENSVKTKVKNFFSKFNEKETEENTVNVNDISE